MPSDPREGVHGAIQAVYRLEWPRLIAGLTRRLRDLDLAEEAAQDALVAALEQWATGGIPDNPGAWLMATAKHHALNGLRRRKLGDRKREALGAEPPVPVPDPEARLDDDVGDDLLRLILIACHPVLPIEARVPLTLRLLGGLATEEIARAFLTSEATVAQRIVRAKRTLAEARVPFEVPRGEELRSRLGAALAVVYLIFNEGYAASAGDALVRTDLCEDALRLARMLQELAPGEPEVHGLAALLELQAARLPARVGRDGAPVLLLDQDRGRWDWLLVERGLRALLRAGPLTAAPGPYVLQAAIAACHAQAPSAAETDWGRIADLYDQLAASAPSAVVALNRAVAHSMAFGPAAGLELLAPLEAEPALRGYHLLPAARADMLARLGRRAAARVELERAAGLTQNARQRKQLLARAAALA